MKILLIVSLFSSVMSLSAYAQYIDYDQYIGKPYSEVRESLMHVGWEAVTNQQIQDSSFYAQGVFVQGYEEVLDCISMERDQCQFVLQKNKQLILITTKEKALNVESIEVNNK